ncbi:MAG: hypothetical protein ACKOI2_00425 [Actinomycetota bacterium]
MIVDAKFFAMGEKRMKQRVAFGAIFAALVGGVVLPGPVAQADLSCNFYPSPLRFTIDSQIFDSRETFDPNDSRFLRFFYPRQRQYEVTYPGGPNGGLEWGTPFFTIGGTTHVGSPIDFQNNFPNPAVVPDTDTQIAMSAPFWYYALEMAERFFPGLAMTEDALWDPLNYPVSYGWELSFSTGSNTCLFAAEFQVADGHGFDSNIEVNHYLDRASQVSKALPDTN